MTIGIIGPPIAIGAAIDAGIAAADSPADIPAIALLLQKALKIHLYTIPNISLCNDLLTVEEEVEAVVLI